MVTVQVMVTALTASASGRPLLHWHGEPRYDSESEPATGCRGALVGPSAPGQPWQGSSEAGTKTGSESQSEPES